MFEESASLIANLGFPIGITIYLLFRFEKKIETLEAAITKLTSVLASKEEH